MQNIPRTLGLMRGLSAITRFFGTMFIFGAFIGACGGAGGDGRLETVHHSFAAMGMMMAGEVVEGELGLGAQLSHSRQLDAGRCYNFLALGSEGLLGVTLSVRDGDGTELGARASQGTDAAVRVCPRTDGQHEISVGAERAGGHFSVTAWAVPVSSCATPFELNHEDALVADEGAYRWVVDGQTLDGRSSLSGGCIDGSNGASEHVYAFEVEEPSDVVVSVEATFDSGLYLRATCTDADTAYHCNDDTQGVNPRLRAQLEPGRYFLVIDGYGGEYGSYRMNLSTTPQTHAIAACREAEELRVGGATQVEAGEDDLMDLPVYERAGEERLYRLSLEAESEIRLRRDGDSAGAIGLRGSCEDGMPVLDFHPATVQGVYPPGHYIVQVEGETSQLWSEVSPAERSEGLDLSRELRASTDAPEPAIPEEEEVDDAPTTSTDLRTQIQAAFRTLNPAMQECWEEVINRIPGLERGRFTAEFTVQPTGGLSTVRLESESAGVPAVVGLCLNDVLRTQFRVEAFEGDAVSVIYPIVLRTEGVDESAVRGRTAALASSCSEFEVRELTLNGIVEGSTSGASGQMGASCAGGAGAAEDVYRLVITEPTTVRLLLFSEFDAALHIRDSCAADGVELSCNDDLVNRYHSALVTRLEPGTYFVFVDGFGREGVGDYGAYRLHVFSGPRNQLPEAEEQPTLRRRGRRR